MCLYRILEETEWSSEKADWLEIHPFPVWETPSKYTLKGGKKNPTSFQEFLSRLAEISDIYFDS